MKKIMRFLSMATLALVGAVMTGCSAKEEFQQTEETSKLVTLTTTVGLDGDAATRALTSTGVKTFAKDDKIAVIYLKNGGTAMKAVSAALTTGDITNGGKSATFTVTLDDPDKTVPVTYIYPAAIVDENFSFYGALATQNGTLGTLSSKLDLSMQSGDWNGDNLPSLTLQNELAILAITLKNSDGSSEVTGGITNMTISDGSNTYTVNRSPAAGPIYVAIHPTSSANIEITANSSSKYYSKSLTGKTYEAGNGYNVSWKMTEVSKFNLSTITENFEAKDGNTLTGTLGANVQISIANNATVTLDNVTINGTHSNSYKWAGINCEGNATIILKEGTTNTVKGFHYNYPGIHVPSGKTLTIRGGGSLNASSNGYGAGIGGGYGGGSDPIIDCGHIDIQGGSITATGGGGCAGIGGGQNGACGNITIEGGAINATGGAGGAGIGSGVHSSCGTITITSGATVTARKGAGSDPANSIGAGESGSCGTVTIGGTEYWNGSAYQNDGETYLQNSPRSYPSGVINLAEVTEERMVYDNEVLRGTLGANVKIKIDKGAHVTLDNVTINGVDNESYSWAGITCLGDATINLVGSNSVKGFSAYYPGIWAAHNDTGSGSEYTLTIQGEGSLTVSTNGSASGIGAPMSKSGGNVLIKSGTITAVGGGYCAGIGSAFALGRNFGDITITGGTVTATGGNRASAIGSGYYLNDPRFDPNMGDILISGGTVTAIAGIRASAIGAGEGGGCGTITITNGVTKVIAMKTGDVSPNSVGVGKSGYCRTITIGNTVYWGWKEGTSIPEVFEYKNGGENYLTTATLVYEP